MTAVIGRHLIPKSEVLNARDCLGFRLHSSAAGVGILRQALFKMSAVVLGPSSQSGASLQITFFSAFLSHVSSNGSFNCVSSSQSELVADLLLMHFWFFLPGRPLLFRPRLEDPPLFTSSFASLSPLRLSHPMPRFSFAYMFPLFHSRLVDFTSIKETTNYLNKQSECLIV